MLSTASLKVSLVCHCPAQVEVFEVCVGDTGDYTTYHTPAVRLSEEGVYYKTVEPFWFWVGLGEHPQIDQGVDLGREASYCLPQNMQV